MLSYTRCHACRCLPVFVLTASDSPASNVFLVQYTLSPKACLPCSLESLKLSVTASRESFPLRLAAAAMLKRLHTLALGDSRSPSSWTCDLGMCFGLPSSNIPLPSLLSCGKVMSYSVAEPVRNRNTCKILLASKRMQLAMNDLLLRIITLRLQAAVVVWSTCKV